MKQKRGILDNYFGITQYGSNMRTEILAGLTTFITLAYILVLNPQVLADPYVIMGDVGMATKIANGVFIGTCVGAFIGTILCSIYAKTPFAQAPGMGLNAFFAYTVVLGMGYTYNQTLVIVLISGIFFIVITTVGLREAIIRAIPDCVKAAITPGIGLFITIIGLKNSGLVVANDATLVGLVDFSTWRTADVDKTLLGGALVSIIGLITIGVLHVKKVRGSVLIGILVSTIIGIPMGVTKLSSFDMNIAGKFRDFMEVSFFKLDFAGLVDNSGSNALEIIFTIFMLVISFSLVNMFDSIGTLMGAAKQSGVVDENGEPVHMKEALMSDAISTAAGALVGTSTVTTVVECSSGIAVGGKTGMTSLTTAFLCLGAIVFAPVINVIPSQATAPALIFVGILMLSNIKEVDFSAMENALPAFCTIVFMPFTYSIANGIAFGLITYTLMEVFTGKMKRVKPLSIIVAIIFIVRYAFMTL